MSRGLGRCSSRRRAHRARCAGRPARASCGGRHGPRRHRACWRELNELRRGGDQVFGCVRATGSLLWKQAGGSWRELQSFGRTGCVGGRLLCMEPAGSAAESSRPERSSQGLELARPGARAGRLCLLEVKAASCVERTERWLEVLAVAGEAMIRPQPAPAAASTCPPDPRHAGNNAACLPLQVRGHLSTHSRNSMRLQTDRIPLRLSVLLVPTRRCLLARRSLVPAHVAARWSAGASIHFSSHSIHRNPALWSLLSLSRLG